MIDNQARIIFNFQIDITMPTSFPRNKSELANYLGVSLSTVKRWLKAKSLHVPRGIIAPQTMKQILKTLGYEVPPPYNTDNQPPKKPR